MYIEVSLLLFVIKLVESERIWSQTLNKLECSLYIDNLVIPLPTVEAQMRNKVLCMCVCV